MIRSITITNDLAESVLLELRNPDSSGFFVRGIEGLGPVKATINTRESLSLDGNMFNSARIGERNIVFNLGFLEKPTIEDVRQKSYKYFPLKRPINISIETDNKTTKTTGYVESNDPNIFSPEEACVVSVICPDPYFYSMESSVVEFSSIVSGFSFPFSNESLVQKLLMFGNIVADTQKDIVYYGEASIGFTINIHILGSVNNLTIYNLITREYMALDSSVLTAITGSNFVVGDEVIISTLRGNKYIKLIRDGEEINVLNILTPDSSWLQLNRGVNTFYYTADSGISNVQFTIEYLTVYEGI